MACLSFVTCHYGIGYCPHLRGKVGTTCNCKLGTTDHANLVQQIVENIWLILVQKVQPHQPEAVAVLGHTVQPTCLSSDITLDDLVASLRLEQGEVAAALVKARDGLQEQARLQHEYDAKQAAAAAAVLAAEKAKPKARQSS